MTRHLVLVGMMGAGKTTVGAECARRLGRPFVDVDDVIEATAERSIGEIFAVDGEAVFRALERDAVTDVTQVVDPMVIACGGGAVLDARSRRQLRRHGFVVWLQAEAATLARRVRDDGRDRPLLAGHDAPAATLQRLATARAGAYEAVAHAAVDTTGRTVAEVVDAVLSEYAQCSG